MKEQALVDYKTNPRALKISENTEEPTFQEAMSYLRFAFYEGKEDKLIQLISEEQIMSSNKKFQAISIKPITIENEITALQKLALLCTEGLCKYNTTFEDDKELLLKKELTYNERNCITFRLTEKKVYMLI